MGEDVSLQQFKDAVKDQAMPKADKQSLDVKQQGSEVLDLVKKAPVHVLGKDITQLSPEKLMERKQKVAMWERKRLDQVRHFLSLARQNTHQLTERFRQSKPTSSQDWSKPTNVTDASDRFVAQSKQVGRPMKKVA